MDGNGERVALAPTEEDLLEIPGLTQEGAWILIKAIYIKSTNDGYILEIDGSKFDVSHSGISNLSGSQRTDWIRLKRRRQKTEP